MHACMHACMHTCIHTCTCDTSAELPEAPREAPSGQREQTRLSDSPETRLESSLNLPSEAPRELRERTCQRYRLKGSSRLFGDTPRDHGSDTI